MVGVGGRPFCARFDLKIQKHLHYILLVSKYQILEISNTFLR